jgi:hypothetical protein
MVLKWWQSEHYWLRYDTFVNLGEMAMAKKSGQKVKGAKKKGSGSGSGWVAVMDRCSFERAFEWC